MYLISRECIWHGTSGCLLSYVCPFFSCQCLCSLTVCLVPNTGIVYQDIETIEQIMSQTIKQSVLTADNPKDPSIPEEDDDEVLALLSFCILIVLARANVQH